MDEKNFIFRGRLTECLHHLREQMEQKDPKSSRGASRARQPIADFCDAGVQSVRRWLYHPDKPPLGEQWFKMLCYLELHGYELIELEKITNPVIRGLVELIGYGLVSMDEMTEISGYSTRSTLFRVLHGDHKPTEGHMDRLRQIWSEWRNLLAEEKKKAKSAINGSTDSLSVEKVESGRPDVATELSAKTGSPLNPVVLIMDGLLMLLSKEEVLSERDIERLSSSDATTILRLSARLSSLASRLISTRRNDGR